MLGFIAVFLPNLAVLIPGSVFVINKILELSSTRTEPSIPRVILCIYLCLYKLHVFFCLIQCKVGMGKDDVM